MENQTIINPSDTSSANPLLVNQPQLSSQTKSNLMMPVLLTVVVSAAVFGFGGYYLGRMASKPQSVIKDQAVAAPSAMPVTRATSSPEEIQLPNYSTWQSYTNPSALYEVKYPSGWKIVQFNPGEGFGPREISEDVLWGINIYEKSKYTLDQVAAEFGKQFSDRRQTKQSIMLNKFPAIKYVTTTPSIADWYSESIIIDSETNYIVISNGANTNENLQKYRGVEVGTTFEKFYNSFNFVN